VTDHYAYRVVWSADDDAYVGTAAEWRGLSWLAVTPEEALRGIRALVAESVQDCVEDGIPVPEPLADRVYSGKFQVRIPPELHRNLSFLAAEQSISLNRLVSLRLSAPSLTEVLEVPAPVRAKRAKPVATKIKAPRVRAPRSGTRSGREAQATAATADVAEKPPSALRKVRVRSSEQEF
jgi:predicted HicB family RNase H-like nuclease